MIRKPKIKNLKIVRWMVFFVLTVFFVSGNSSEAVGLAGTAEVESVNRDETLNAASVFPSDPLFAQDETTVGKQWYLNRIKVPDAWGQITGGSITVAIVDTGIDGLHEDLADGRVGRGFASYCQVRSAAGTDCSVRITTQLASGINSDDNGHGTIVAGIIGAIPNNGKGITGINWNLRLMPIKVLDQNGSGFASDAAIGIRWAADNGAKIINLSLGGESLSGIDVLQEAVSYAFNKGVLVVSAAGNDSAENGINLNTHPVVPICADGGANMVIGVAAVDIADRKAKFSNYGSNCVDVAAPGAAIFIDRQNQQGLISTYFDPKSPTEHNLYAYAVGTSVAAPMVSGVAALMISAFPELDVTAIRDRLLLSVDGIDALNVTGCGTSSCGGQIGKGRLNALKALTLPILPAGGDLFRDASGRVYLVEKGTKRPISEFVLKQRFLNALVGDVTESQLKTIPTGPAVPPADTTLVKEPDNPTIYLVEEEKLHALSYLAFVSRNLKFSEVVQLSSVEVAIYAKGPDVVVLNGVLIKSTNHPAVYIVNNGIRQLLSHFVWKQRFLNSQIAEIDSQELEKFVINSGVLYPPLDGTLIKGEAELQVYLIQDRARRALNYGAFNNRSFNFDSLAILPQSEVNGYETGEDIIE